MGIHSIVDNGFEDALGPSSITFEYFRVLPVNFDFQSICGCSSHYLDLV